MTEHPPTLPASALSADEATYRERIAANVRRLRDRIAEVALTTGRQPTEVALMAATKTRTATEVDAVIAAGVTLIGENRVQEAAEKKPRVVQAATWHMIGHLQTNKVNQALGLFSAIQSVDSYRLAAGISAHAEALGRMVEVLVEVNTSGEKSKYGVAPEAALDLIAAVQQLARLRVLGLMTMGLLLNDERRVRACFAMLRRLRDEAQAAYGMALPVLSMGMTSDFPWAIAEGSTMVRIGTAMFGARD